MKLNFVGNFQNGYVGEVSDCVHLAREIEELGHTVNRIPQDEWREHVLDGKDYPHIPKDLSADANIITKWHHFDDSKFIRDLRIRSGGPVFYWCWDYMEYNGSMPDWHNLNLLESDLYLGNDVRNPYYKDYGMCYYFPFDVCDGDLPVHRVTQKTYDVVFTGSYIDQGNRIEFLREINKHVPVTIFAWNYEEWEKEGFKAFPALYGSQYNLMIAQSKIVLGMSVEPNCWGYWSNRVGKVLRAGGCLLYEYAPGMELAIGDAAAYFTTPQEAVERITYLLEHEDERGRMENKAISISEQFTSRYRVKQLMVLIDRFLKGKVDMWQM